MSSHPRENKTYENSPSGLRDALFDELADLRNGVTSPHYATAVAKIATTVINTYEVELKREYLTEARRRNDIQERLAPPAVAQIEDHSEDAEFSDAPTV